MRRNVRLGSRSTKAHLDWVVSQVGDPRVFTSDSGSWKSLSLLSLVSLVFLALMLVAITRSDGEGFVK